MKILDGAMMGVAAWDMFGAVLGAAIGAVLMNWLGHVTGDALRAETRVATGAVTTVKIELVILRQHCFAAWRRAEQAATIASCCALHSQNMLTAPCTVCKQMCIGSRWLQTTNTI